MEEPACSSNVVLIQFVFSRKPSWLGHLEFDQCELTYIPNMEIELDEEGKEKIYKLVETLEDNDDVQDVYYNLKED